MKKNLIGIFFAIFFMVIMVDVYADSSVYSGFYEVIVQNKNGAVCYDSYSEEVILPYKKILRVFYENEDEDELEVFNEDGSCSIKVEDVLPLEYKGNKLDEKMKVKVFGAEGAYLYEGPSEIYKKLSVVIPKDTELQITHDDFNSVWGYTTYKGISGWIFVGTDSTNLKENFWLENGFTPESLKLYKNYDLKGEVITTIPANTALKISYEYGCLGEHCDSAYVNYNGKQGFVSWNKITWEENNNEIIVNDDTILYKDAECTKPSDINLKGNTIIKKYYYNAYSIDNVYVNYQGKYGFILDKKYNYLYDDEDIEQVTASEDIVIYEKMNENSQVLATIKSGESYNKLSHFSNFDENNYRYISYNNIKGWIHNDIKNNTDEKPTEDNSDNESKKEENIFIKWYKSLSFKQFILLCVGTAFVIAITSLVIIILIKKSKNKKADNKIIKEEESSKVVNNDITDVKENKDSLDSDKKISVNDSKKTTGSINDNIKIVDDKNNED